VFINMDPNASSLKEYLGEPLVRHFERWPLHSHWKSVHVAKVFQCNWKLSLLAFVEAYHVLQTHSEWIPFTGDSSTQYDVYGLHSRLIVPTAVQSAHMAGVVLSDQQIVESMTEELFANIFSATKTQLPPLAPGTTAREAVADHRRRTLSEQTGRNYDSRSDAEMIDMIQYTLFPNVAIFPGELGPLIYRVRPDGDHHESSLFEMIVLSPVADGAVRPPAAPVRVVAEHETWFDVPELATVARNLTQDTTNLEQIQQAQHSRGFPGPTYARYQEMGLRQFHRVLDEWLSRD
jgi:hypothetical protein